MGGYEGFDSFGVVLCQMSGARTMIESGWKDETMREVDDGRKKKELYSCGCG